VDKACLQHQLTDQEKATFERDGYLIVDNAIPQEMVEELTPISDRIDAQQRERLGLTPEARVNHYDFIGKDDAYLPLLDWHTTFPKVWGLLNWHIQLYHTHMTYTPPEPVSLEEHGLGLGWHQDSGTLNQDLESTPRPRVSIKIAYFLSDTTETGRGGRGYTSPTDEDAPLRVWLEEQGAIPGRDQ
jgi:ectoine hydroxylase|tara:strand:- start:25 stop:582 length:558 start_codon:yes stop_codon:yes gene_type:complete